MFSNVPADVWWVIIGGGVVMFFLGCLSVYIFNGKDNSDD